MSIIRRAILAFALIAGICPAFAQAPPPVPALPDTERRTSYSLAASTCACAVGFQLYGDSTDVANWLTVWVNGVQVAPSGNWTISSPTGQIGTIPRPITDAVLTFAAVQTGTVQIVGARRPRRASQFSENRGVSARDLNQVLTDIIAMEREVWDKTNDVTGRAVLAPAGETLALLPVLASRANMGACFDNGGNLTSCVSVPSGAFTAGNGITFTGTGPTTIAVSTMTANTVKGNSTGSPAAPSDMAMPSCSVSTSALMWTSGSGFGCHSVSRIILTAQLDFYINAGSGIDNTTCGLASGASACATPNYARARVQNGYDLAGFSVVFRITGNFASGIRLDANGPLVGQVSPNSELWSAEGGLTINAGSGNIAIHAIYNAKLNWVVDASGMTITAGGATGVCVATSDGGFVNFVSGSLTTNGCGQYTLQTSWGGTIIIGVTMFFQGNNFAAIYVSGGLIQMNPGVSTGVIGTPAYGKAFIWSYNGTFGSGATYGGAATGTRWIAELNGVISCGCTANTTFPGNANGSLLTGGQIN